jgi:hypothetical protein
MSVRTFTTYKVAYNCTESKFKATDSATALNSLNLPYFDPHLELQRIWGVLLASPAYAFHARPKATSQRNCVRTEVNSVFTNFLFKCKLVCMP